MASKELGREREILGEKEIETGEEIEEAGIEKK